MFQAHFPHLQVAFLTDLNGRMSAIPSSGSKADVNAALKQQINEIILIETPRHLVDKEEDLDRLFPRCPPNTLESVAKVNRKSKKKNLNTVSTSHINNNICQQEAAAKEIQNQPLQVGKIIDLVSSFYMGG